MSLRIILCIAIGQTEIKGKQDNLIPSREAELVALRDVALVIKIPYRRKTGKTNIIQLVTDTEQPYVHTQLATKPKSCLLYTSPSPRD